MFYTLTCNPSLDYLMEVQRLKVGQVNRSKRSRIVAGGKGLNVAIVLKNFGEEVKALAVTAGFTGEEWLRLVKEENVPVEVVKLDNGETRINVKLLGVDQTDINVLGPIITQAKIVEGYKLFEQVKGEDTFVISGNGLPGMIPTAYANIIDHLSVRGTKIALDATNDLMRNALPCHPYIIKPNIEELMQIGNTYLDTQEDIINCCNRLMRMGARNILVSMGKDGALFLGEDGLKYKVNAPKGRVKNTVGAGDSMLAAFLHATEHGMDIKDAVKLSVAAGSATAFSENLATSKEVYDILEKVEGTEV